MGTGRFPTAHLDLSLLPAPNAISPLVYEDIRTARVNDLVARMQAAGIPYNVQSLESDPAIIIQEEDAYRELIDKESINDAVRAVMIATAEGSDLDQVLATIGVRRLVLAPAVTTVVPNIPAVMESDDSFRARGQNALEATAVGLTGGGYKHLARLNPAVKDVSIIRFPLGVVNVILQGFTADGTLTDDVVAAVNNLVQADDECQLTDTASVQSVEALPYAIHAIATIPRGPSAAIVQATAVSGFTATASRLQVIGGTAGLDALMAGGRSNVMRRLQILSPSADVIAARNQNPNCTSVTVDMVVSDS